LIYEKQENLSTTYRWTGKQALVIQDVALLNRNAERPSKAIDRATQTLNKSIVRMGIYILILLGAILLELWRFQ
jgi:hypothetical protein